MGSKGSKLEIQAKGFRIKFQNKWSVSVQIGGMNYCDHYMNSNTGINLGPSTTAETAVFDHRGNMVEVPRWPGNTVQGYQTMNDVLAILNWAASQ